MEQTAILIRGQARLLADVSSAWRSGTMNHLPAKVAFLLRSFADVVRRVGEAQAESFRLLHARQIVDPLRMGLEVRHSLAEALQACEEIATDVATLPSQVARDAVSAFEEAHARLRGLVKEFNERWPLADDDAVARGRAEIAAGRFKTLDEVLRELDNPARQ